jgi:hypothetical protein
VNLPAGIKPGDIGLVGGQPGEGVLDRFFEDSIQWATASPVNHAFIYIGQGKIVEAIRRVSVSPVTNYTGIRWSTCRLPAVDAATDAQREQAVAYALSRVGEHYNIPGLLAVGLYQRRTGHLVSGHEWWVRLLNGDHMDFCSELVTKCWLAGGVSLFPRQLPVTVSPGEIYGLYAPAVVQGAPRA